MKTKTSILISLLVTLLVGTGAYYLGLNKSANTLVPTPIPSALPTTSPAASPTTTLKKTSATPTPTPIAKKSEGCPFFYYAEFNVANGITSPTIAWGIETNPQTIRTVDLYVVNAQGAKSLIKKLVFSKGQETWTEPVQVPDDAIKLRITSCNEIQEVDLMR